MARREELEAIRDLKKIRREKKRIKFIGYIRKKGLRVKYVRCK